MTPSMFLISSSWAGSPTFKLIPVSQDCPYNEVIFDPTSQALAIVSKEKKTTLHMLPKLTDIGDVMRIKVQKRENGKDYAETRVNMETFYEYFIEEKAEILHFISSFAANADNFDYMSTVESAFNAAAAPKPDISKGPSLIFEP